jgi:two-component system, NtrC family, response regulator
VCLDRGQRSGHFCRLKNDKNMKSRLLIVDDDEDICAQLKWALRGEYEIAIAGDGAGAVEEFKQSRPFVALVDLGLPPNPADPSAGLALISELLALDRLVKVIVITGQAEKSVALKAVGSGAYDFLVKPVQVDELKVILKRAFQMATLERDYIEMENRCRVDCFEGMFGASQPMQHVYASIRKVATTDAPVLILGESGTGKEMAAMAIHRRSARKAGPFVPINCGAIPEMLLESELFGHEKGSFTGAHARRKGRIESAVGGTLFLDEIGELPLELQVKLLRFLQEQTIERVGGRELIPVDTRVIAATNSDISKAMSEGRFREDLYYRLAVVVLKLPPLREREDDTLLLAQAFLKRLAAESGKSASPKFTRAAMVALAQHNWPGNVRQLENCVRRAVIMADGRYVTEMDLGLTGAPAPPPSTSLKEARENLDRHLVQRVLHAHAGNISAAAAELGISRPTLYELIDKLGMRRTDNEKPPI